MANPMRDEDKIYEQIEKENITVHPVVWELISHHVRNDLNLASVAIGSLRMTPKWILATASWVIRFLYKISRQPGLAPENLNKICDMTLQRVKGVDKFLKKLKEVTCKND